MAARTHEVALYGDPIRYRWVYTVDGRIQEEC